MAVSGGILFLFFIFTITFVNSEFSNFHANFNETSRGDENASESCLELRSYALTLGEKSYLTWFHNSLRKNISKNIGDQSKAIVEKQIIWDDKLAQMAQEWANNCTDTENVDLDKSIGQYIITSFTSDGSDRKVKIKDLLQTWAAKLNHPSINIKYQEHERDDYGFEPLGQILWWKTERLGCGRAIYKQGCRDTNCTEPNRIIKLVCNYSPTGNGRVPMFGDSTRSKNVTCGDGSSECSFRKLDKTKVKDVEKEKKPSGKEYRVRSKVIELYPATGSQGRCQLSNIKYFWVVLVILNNVTNLLKLI